MCPQTPCQRYWKQLLKWVEEGKLHPDMVRQPPTAPRHITRTDREPAPRRGCKLLRCSQTLRYGFKTSVANFQGCRLQGFRGFSLPLAQVITHKLPLKDAPHGYKIFNNKEDGCVKVVLKPWEGLEE